MNLTTTVAPLFDNVTNTINIHLDGLFFDQEAKTTHVKPNTVFPKRIANKNSNQFFIHESMLNSLFFAFHKQMMPIMITEADAVAQILQLLPEVKKHYGEDSDISIGVDLAPFGETAIKLDKERGIILGDLDEVKLIMTIYASNHKV